MQQSPHPWRRKCPRREGSCPAQRFTQVCPLHEGLSPGRSPGVRMEPPPPPAQPPVICIGTKRREFQCHFLILRRQPVSSNPTLTLTAQSQHTFHRPGPQPHEAVLAAHTTHSGVPRALGLCWPTSKQSSQAHRAHHPPSTPTQKLCEPHCPKDCI